MYSFEGEFRRKPIQSLGGASKKEHRISLLNRLANEREKRDAQRKQKLSAQKIQSYFRSHLVRQKLRENQRQLFDGFWKRLDNGDIVEDEKVIGELLQRIIVFYNQSVDCQRLISVSQILLKRHTLLARAILSSNYVWKYRIKRLLLMNLNLLTDELNSSLPIATPMRILEVFTNGRTYSKLCTTEQTDNLLWAIFEFLLKNGYYKKLKKLISVKVPDSLIKSPMPPTELAASIFDLILSPIKRIPKINEELRNHPLLGLTEAFLACQFTSHISCFVLPALTKSADVINFKHLLSAIYDKNNDKLKVPATIQLLFSILQFFQAQNNLHELSKDLDYVLVMSHLCKTLPQKSSTFQKKINYDSDSEDEIMEIDSNTELNLLAEECVEIMNDANHVNYILDVLDVHEDKEKCLTSVCKICHSLLTHSKLAVYHYRLLYKLAFRSTFVRRLWDSAASSFATSIFGSRTPLLQVLARGFNLSSSERDLLLPQLALFCSLFSYLLVTVHDSELDNSEKACSLVPFTLKELIGMTLTLRDVCLGLIELAYPDTRIVKNEEYKLALYSVANSHQYHYENSVEEAESWSHLFRVVVNIVRQLHSRDTRRKFCPEGHWLTVRISLSSDKSANLHFGSLAFQRYQPFRGVQVMSREELEDSGPPLSSTELRTIKVLKELPFVISFTERVKIFHLLIQKDKIRHQNMSGFMMGPMIRINIRRNYIYEDAFEKLSQKNVENLKLKMSIKLINAQGLDEAGIDGGGVFREFLNVLLKAGFDPNRGFFKATSDELLFPNPHVNLIHENSNEHFYFLGRMLGKAIYENMLVELPFAAFFLAKLLGKQSTSVDIHHLDSLDHELYKNLISLKSYEGDVSSLGIDFTVTNSVLGETQTVELKPSGSNIPVTSSNAIEYIHLVSDYKLNKQIQEQCSSFKQGLGNVINLEWLQMFDNRELQVLISGASVPIDVDDMKKHTVYTSDYKDDHPVILKFWTVVQQFSQQQLQKLLKFVTSCSHPPLLGFKELQPLFCIQNGGNEVDRLPTASTCMNLLKLPEFQDEEMLKEKLLYAIESESGFELS